MLDGLDAAALDARMAAAGEEARAVVAAAAIPVERIDIVYELDMHYLGQTHTVAVPLPVTLASGRYRDQRSAGARRIRSDLRRRVRPPVARHPDPDRVVAHRRHRTPAAVRPDGVRAAGRRRVVGGGARRAARLVCGRLARGAGLVAARSPRRRRHRGAGDPRTARRHDLHRTGLARPHRSARQRDRRARPKRDK